MESNQDYKRAYEMQKKARKIAEKRLEDKSRELYGKNKKLASAFEQLGQQQEKLIAQEKLASIGQLSAGLAHELNNPNAFIKNNILSLNEYIENLIAGLDIALSTIDNLNDSPKSLVSKEALDTIIKSIKDTSDINFIREDLKDIIDESLKGSKRIENIANSLHFFSNPDLSNSKQADINECLIQAQKLIAKNLLNTVKINLNLTKKAYTSGNPLLITQALSNIIVNAIEAKPKSGDIKIETTNQNNFVTIKISDDGIGISPQKLETVFHPFVTDSNTNHGLGLNIAQSIILQHNGDIFLKSEEEKGTVVHIKFPTTILD